MDVGTGSGCIAVSLKMALPKCQVTGIDISEKALEVARANGVLNEVQVSFHHGDAMKMAQLEEVNKKWDVVVSNPPYIPIKEKAFMDRNVVDYDPSLALFVPNDKPLMYYESIAKWAFNILQKKGALYFEIHENFGSEVSDLLINLGFLKVSIIQDLQGKDRIVKAII